MNRTRLFLLVFAVSLFLGDGRQTGLDLYWALVTVATTVLWKEQGEKTLPWALFLLGSSFLLAGGISAVASWSPGYSVSSIMRTVVAFVWVIRFSTLTKKEIASFAHDSLILGLIFTPLALLALLVPAIPRILPPLNLIALPSGHLPIAYVALALIPILLAKTQENPQNALGRWSVASSVFAVLLSFSRAATALMVLFLIFGLPRRAWRPKPIIVISLLAGLVAIFSLLFPAGVSDRFDRVVPGAWRSYLLKKETVLTNSRLAYLTQTIKAFEQSPIVGTGPGTFALISKQFAASSALMSTSAHNIWIQTAAEYGIIGITPLLLAIVYFALLGYRQRNGPEKIWLRAFFASIGLTLLLAAVEQSLDRYGILIFFSACLGMILTLSPSRGKRTNVAKFSVFLTILLAVYIGSWIVSDLASASRKVALSYRLAPYRRTLALALVAQNPEAERPVRQWFFPRDPEIDAILASREKDMSKRAFWYEKAIKESPNDPFLERDYLAFLLTLENPPVLCKELMRFAKIGEIDCAEEPPWILTGVVETSLPFLSSPEGPSQFFYGVGLGLLEKPQAEPLAIKLWTRAQDLSPSWGYYYAELGSLIASYNRSYEAAVPTLRRCLTNRYTRDFCQYVLDRGSDIPPPGTFSKEIFAIPAIIDASP